MNKHLMLQELKSLNKVPIWVEDVEYLNNSGWHIIERNNGECLCLIGLSSNGYTGENWIGYRINSKDEMNPVPSKYKEYLAFPVRPVMRGCILNSCAIVRYNKTNNRTDIVIVEMNII